jgi:predicted nuclease with TOPRIM domain
LTAVHFEDVTHQERFHELHKEASWTLESFQKCQDECERLSAELEELRDRIASMSEQHQQTGEHAALLEECSTTQDEWERSLDDAHNRETAWLLIVQEKNDVEELYMPAPSRNKPVSLL